MSTRWPLTPPPAADYEGLSPTLIAAHHSGVVVCHKPAGLPTAGHALDDPDCLQSAVMARLGKTRVWAVHQLDRDTSGIVVMVTKKPLVALWTERLRFPLTMKRYLALCHGAFEGGDITIDAAVGPVRRADGRTTPALLSEADGGKPAGTQVRLMGVSKDRAFSLLECTLETGRTHQIRVHLASLGHPLIGERLHRDPPCNWLRHHGLHAHRLEFEEAPLGVPADAWTMPPREEFLMMCRAGEIDCPGA